MKDSFDAHQDPIKSYGKIVIEVYVFNLLDF